MTDEVEKNKGGRPPGSRNKITLLKMMGEEATRERNFERMLLVCDHIITEALAGNRDCRKLVWSAVMSKSGADAAAATGAIPEINIRVQGSAAPEVSVEKPLAAEPEIQLN